MVVTQNIGKDKDGSHALEGQLFRRRGRIRQGPQIAYACTEQAACGGSQGLAEHRAKHHDLSAKLAEFLSRDKNADQTMYVAFLYFVRDWFKDHMLNVDREYAPLLKNHGIK